MNTQAELNFDGSNIRGAIKAAHDAVLAAQKSAVKHAAECGRLLAAAKETVPHGGWEAWVAENCSFSLRTAQLYMKLADYLADGDPAKAQRVALLSLREVGAFLLESKKTREENDIDLKKREAKDLLLNHWLNAGPLERRSLITILGLRRLLPLSSCTKQLRWLAKNDGPEHVAAIKELENPGLEFAELLRITPFDRQPLISPKDAEKLFVLAGKPAATAAVVMAIEGYFADASVGVK